MLKHRILFILTAVCSILPTLAQKPNAIWFNTYEDGVALYFLAENKPVWQPTIEKQIITYEGVQYIFDNKDYECAFVYADPATLIPTQISSPEVLLPKVIISDESITVIGNSDESSIYIFGIDGILYLEERVDPSGTRTVRTTDLPSGTYIIKFGSLTLKFVKK